jgi:hypothetical protein
MLLLTLLAFVIVCGVLVLGTEESRAVRRCTDHELSRSARAASGPKEGRS